MATLARQATLVQQDQLVHRDPRVRSEHLDPLRLELPDHQEPLVHKDQRVQQDSLANPVLLDLVDSRAPREQLGHRVQQVQQVGLVSLDNREVQELQEYWDLRVQLDQQALLDNRVKVVHRAALDSLVQQVLVDKLDPAGMQDLAVLRVPLDTLEVQTANGTGADYDLWSGVAADFSLVDPNLSPNNGVPSGINPFPISDVLAATGLHNDYLMSPDILGATDWVITFPMRKHGIFNNYRYDGITTTARQGNKSNAKADVVNFVYVGNDVQFTYKAYDREEQIPTLNVGFSPAVKGDKSLLPREANVIQWNYEGGVASNGVLGTPTDSAIKLTIQAGYTEGWAQLTYVAGTYNGNYLSALANAGWTSSTSIPAWVVGSYTSGAYGVPSIGFAAIKAGSGQYSVGETISHVFTTN